MTATLAYYRITALMSLPREHLRGWPKVSIPDTYTDEPVFKKDVAPGQNFSRFNLLTKITVFPFLGYPTADNSQDSLGRHQGSCRRRFFSKVYSGGAISSSQKPQWTALKKESCPAMNGRLTSESSLLIGARPQVFPLHDSSVDRIQPGRSRSLDYALVAAQIKFRNFQHAAGSDRRAHHQFE